MHANMDISHLKHSGTYFQIHMRRSVLFASPPTTSEMGTISIENSVNLSRYIVVRNLRWLIHTEKSALDETANE